MISVQTFVDRQLDVVHCSSLCCTKVCRGRTGSGGCGGLLVALDALEQRAAEAGLLLLDDGEDLRRKTSRVSGHAHVMSRVHVMRDTSDCNWYARGAGAQCREEQQEALPPCPGWHVAQGRSRQSCPPPSPPAGRRSRSLHLHDTHRLATGSMLAHRAPHHAPPAGACSAVTPSRRGHGSIPYETQGSC